MKVCCVIVVFDERKQFLSRILMRLSEKGINNVIVVNNGGNDLNVSGHKTLNPSKNLGTAGGFTLGMEEALKSDCDHIWLLDEDNLPEPDALNELLVNWEILTLDTPPDILMLYSYRPQLFKYLHASKHKKITSIGPLKNSYLGFHYKQLFQFFSRRILSSGNHVPVGSEENKLVEMDTGYFGGLFFHRSVIEKGFLPDKSFFIYWADLSFTKRFHLVGGSVYMVCSSIIQDMDDEYTNDEKKPFLHHPILDLRPSFKAFDYIKGILKFEKEARENPFTYAINKGLMLSIISLMALFRGKLSRLKLLSKAISAVK